MGLDRFPNELLAEVVSYVLRRRDLHSLLTVSRSIYQEVARQLYRAIKCTPDRGEVEIKRFCRGLLTRSPHNVAHHIFALYIDKITTNHSLPIVLTLMVNLKSLTLYFDTNSRTIRWTDHFPSRIPFQLQAFATNYTCGRTDLTRDAFSSFLSLQPAISALTWFSSSSSEPAFSQQKQTAIPKMAFLSSLEALSTSYEALVISSLVFNSLAALAFWGQPCDLLSQLEERLSTPTVVRSLILRNFSVFSSLVEYFPQLNFLEGYFNKADEFRPYLTSLPHLRTIKLHWQPRQLSWVRPGYGDCLLMASGVFGVGCSRLEIIKIFPGTKLEGCWTFKREDVSKLVTASDLVWHAENKRGCSLEVLDGEAQDWIRALSNADMECQPHCATLPRS